MFSVDIRLGPDGQPLVSDAVLASFPLAAQAIISVLAPLAAQVRGLHERVRALEARLRQTSTNTSRPPWSGTANCRMIRNSYELH